MGSKKGVKRERPFKVGKKEFNDCYMASYVHNRSTAPWSCWLSKLAFPQEKPGMFFLSTRTEWICNFYTNLTFRSPFAALIKRAGNSNCWHTMVTGNAIFRSFCGIPWPHVGRLISMYVSVPFSLQADNITPCLISFGDDSFPQAGEYISSFSLDVSYTHFLL